MIYPRNIKLRFLRVALTATCLATLSGVTALAKDTITSVGGAVAVEVPPSSIGDFNVKPSGGGSYSSPSSPTGLKSSVDMFLGASNSGEWWVNDSSTEPWKALLTANDQFAYHLREDMTAGASFWAAWSLEYQFYEYTSSFRQTNGQIPNGSIISFGLSDSGNPYSDNDSDWNITTETGLSKTDVSGGLNLTTYPGPSVAEFSGAAAFTWRSYEVTGAGSHLLWTLKQEGSALPMTDYVVFVQLPSGEAINANGDSFTDLSDSTMEGNGPTDEIVFNWTIDSKNDTLGNINPEFGDNVSDPCTLEFTDGVGGTPLYQVGDSLFLEAMDKALNANSGAPDTMTVTLTNTRTGETEVVTLTETGNDTDLFALVGGFPTTDTGNTGNDDGTLNVQFGDTVTASALTGGIGLPCSDSYRFPVPANLLKSVDTSTANPGDSLLYTIVPRYPGSGILTAVTVTDAVPANTTISGSPGQGGTHDGGTPGIVTWNLGSVSAASDGFVPGVPGGGWQQLRG